MFYDFITSVKVKFLGEERWSWVTFERLDGGSIISSDDRLTAEWTESGTFVRFRVNADLELEEQVIGIFATRKP